ncbi:hypothetical protein NDU88_002671 [Pleurodeles waltl]|uniref:Uncharacterized protein n=1 Tax=Pleurodeles waltl TaxID=8319 RepID=A0AAV7WQ66_PLEWA|nr:hypothetical protein NDU88_002671 [Pleurodeles waltl]
MNNGGDVNIQPNQTDDSSDPGSSADETPLNKLDFRGEMRLMQMAAPQSADAEDEVAVQIAFIGGSLVLLQSMGLKSEKGAKEAIGDIKLEQTSTSYLLPRD